MARSAHRTADEDLNFDDIKPVEGDATDQLFSDTPVYDSVSETPAGDKWHRAISQRSYAAGPVYAKPSREVPEILKALVEASLEDYLSDQTAHPQMIPFDAPEDAKEFVQLVKAYARQRETVIAVRAHTVKGNDKMVRFYASPYVPRVRKAPAE